MATIRWGMIGCGAVAEVKSGPGFYKADNSTLLAVTSADPALTKSFAERHGVPKAYETSEQLVADAEVGDVAPQGHLGPFGLQHGLKVIVGSRMVFHQNFTDNGHLGQFFVASGQGIKFIDNRPDVFFEIPEISVFHACFYFFAPMLVQFFS